MASDSGPLFNDASEGLDDGVPILLDVLDGDETSAGERLLASGVVSLIERVCV